MKKKIVRSACILKRLEFASEEALNEYLEHLKYRKRQYVIVDRKKFPDGVITIEIKEQYNNNIMF